MAARRRLEYASMSECLVRITYQLIRLDAKRNPEEYVNPFDGLSSFAQFLHDARIEPYWFWVIAYRTELFARDSLADVRRAMLERNERGANFRKVAFGAYKAGRR